MEEEVDVTVKLVPQDTVVTGVTLGEVPGVMARLGWDEDADRISLEVRLAGVDDEDAPTLLRMVGAIFSRLADDPTWTDAP